MKGERQEKRMQNIVTVVTASPACPAVSETGQ